MLTFELIGEIENDTDADNIFTWIYNEIGEIFDKKVLLVCSNLNYISAKGIGYIANLYSLLEEWGWKLVVILTEWHVKDIFELVGLSVIITCFEEKEEGVKFLEQI